MIELITSWDNLFLEDLKKCKESGCKTYIYGAGEGALNVEIRIKKMPIPFKIEGRIVNKKYYKEGEDAIILEELLYKEEKVNLIVAFKGYNEALLENYKEKINIVIDRDCYAGNCFVDDGIWTKEFVYENKNNLESIYDCLEDKKSKDVMLAFINQKLSMCYGYLSKEKTHPQYYESDLIKIEEGEIFVDCGAYNGDSAEQFICRCGSLRYGKIFSFEPDPFNYEKLVKRGFANHVCFNLATSDREDELRFSISNTSSSISNDGEIIIKTVKLDDIICEQVTMIKMDIEGAELASLKGARNIIKNNKPKLAICIYHKKEDVWEILSFLKELVPEYKFYMRIYDEAAIELVLYAIP